MAKDMTRGWRLLWAQEVGRAFVICNAIMLLCSMVSIYLVLITENLYFATMVIGAYICVVTYAEILLTTTIRNIFQLESVSEILFLPFAYVCKFDKTSAPHVYYAARDNCEGKFTFLLTYYMDNVIYGLFQSRQDALMMKLRYT